MLGIVTAYAGWVSNLNAKASLLESLALEVCSYPDLQARLSVHVAIK